MCYGFYGNVTGNINSYCGTIRLVIAMCNSDHETNRFDHDTYHLDHSIVLLFNDENELTFSNT